MKFEKKHWIYLSIAVFVGLVVSFINYQSNILDDTELLLLDRSFYMRNEKPVMESTENGFSQTKRNPRLNPNIIVIGIDEQAIAKFGFFPWKRTIYKQFLEHIQSSKPALVFFDIFFTEYKEDVSEDKAFWDGLSLASRMNLVVDYPIVSDSQNKFDMEVNKSRYNWLLKTSFPNNNTTKFIQSYNNATIPIPEVLSRVDDAAEAVIQQDVDNKYRRVKLVAGFENRLYPFIALSLARIYFQVPRQNVEFNIGKYVKLKGAKIPLMDEFDMVTNYRTRDIAIPVDQNGAMMINYVGYPSEFNYRKQYLSFADAMRVPPETFDGKIVMVGAYAQGMAHDIWTSPLGSMYGIIHNAFAVNTILNQDFLVYVPWWVNILIIFLLCLLIGFFVPRMSMLWGTFFTLGLFGLYELATLVTFSKMNIIILYFAPIIAIVISFAGIIVYRVLTEEKEKKFIKKRFANYVNASVVEELLKNPKALQLGGENKYISVMFSDVRGFTTISEKLGDPQKLVGLLNEYLGAMTEIIFQYDGTLDKYVGDEIMAFWGAPVPQADHHIRACKASIDQMYYLNYVLNPKLREEGKPILDIGIGINTGIMTVGNMGSKNRMDYTLMGDNVNLGARLEGTNKVYGSHIIISEFTYNDVKDNVIVRELDNIKVKGKSKPVRIYELIEVIGHDPTQIAQKISEHK